MSLAGGVMSVPPATRAKVAGGVVLLVVLWLAVGSGSGRDSGLALAGIHAKLDLLLSDRGLAVDEEQLAAQLAALPKQPRATLARGGKAFELVLPDCADVAVPEFDRIFENGEWGGSNAPKPSDFYSLGNVSVLGRRQSISGWGSNLGLNTINPLKFLDRVLPKYGIRTMMDIPCGDINWQMHSWQVDSLAAYVGADVVSKLVALHSRRYDHHSNKRFLSWNLKCPFPKVRLAADKEVRPFDALHVRDVIQHMTMAKGVEVLKNIVASGARYLITTNFPESVNVDIDEGGFYNTNLDLPPFKGILPHPPLECVQTHLPPTDKDAIWENDVTCIYPLQ